MSRLILIPYKMGSASCKALKESLVAAGVRCFRKKVTDLFNPKHNDIILYYGGTNHLQTRVPHAVVNGMRETAINKLKAFQCFTAAGLSTVEWTTEREIASEWYFNNYPVVCRKILSGHSGEGIVIQQKEPEGIFDWKFPLFTKYMKKTFECRIHVMNGKVIDGQIKKKRTDEEANTLIRNAHTGWVYCREGYTPDEAAKQLAIAAVAALGLDFGAVDLIYNKYYNQYYLLEVNTAPGLTGTTLTNYTQEILKWFHS